MRLYNSLTRKIEEIKATNPPIITLYSCGPTVYDYTHIGHLRSFINSDLLKRALTLAGSNVKHVMNITDVGHLTGDTDEGEDKLEKGAQKTGKTVWEVAQQYTDHFSASIDAVNIIKPDHLVRATDHIEAMITLIKKLDEKGFTYETDEAIYFDITKFPNYGQLSGQKLQDKKTAARPEVHSDPQKKQQADFALWFKRVGRFANHEMHWPSPWAPPRGQDSARRGEGFPGWHIECSAMSMKYLGETIDIHTGGIDHIPVHHENEIAQSEAATGKPFVKYWFHSAFLTIEGQKMSKSLNNFYRIEEIIQKGFDPLALRFLFLQTHYRQPLNFTWESLAGAQTAHNKLRQAVLQLKKTRGRTALSEEKLNSIEKFQSEFDKALQDDLQIPQALAVVWQAIKSNIPSEDKLDFVLEADRVLGLGLSQIQQSEVSEEVIVLAQKRQEARRAGNYERSDKLRTQIQEMGFIIEDINDNYQIKPA